MGLFESAKKLLKRWKKEEKTGGPASNFTPRAQQVLALARKESDRFNHNYLGTEHLLLDLIKLGQGTAVKVLQDMGIDLQTIRMAVEKQIGTGPNEKMIGNVPFTPRVKKVLDLARREARNLNHTYIGTEHLLLGLMREGDGIGAQVLRNCGVNLEKLRMAILKELDPNYVPNENLQMAWRESAGEFLKKTESQRSQYTPRAEQTIALAATEAERLHLNYLGTEHLLFGLIALGGAGIATNVLKNQGMSLEKVRVEIEKLANIGGPDDKTSGTTPYTPRMQHVIDLAKQETKALNHTYIGTEHLLLGLLKEKEGPAAQIFKTFNVDMEEMRVEIMRELNPNFGQSSQ